MLRNITGERAVPDADFTHRAGIVALEFERTHKNIGRYRRIFARHERSPYAVVLYVLPEASQLSWLFRCVLPAVVRSSDGGTECLRRFRFALLDQLLQSADRTSVWRASTAMEPVKETFGRMT